ncbi:MAG TPA: aromatic ring-hydroxylating dioxygenase subunit alpha [Pseudonocardia sp.]|nr:aromatic ring-hydroxylating dioxygenase subunit alpha [Pseudonocardia sp.]
MSMTDPGTRATPTGMLTYQQLLDTDSRPVPETLRRMGETDVGPTTVPVARYLDRRYHELEKEHLWSKVWQVACRAEELERIGDTAVYDIADRSYLLVRAQEDDPDGTSGILAFPNACLHRGRALRDGPGRVDELQCPFHGFCWSLKGRLKRVPSAWDFPHVVPDEWELPRLRVDTWGGFVFVNPDPDCEPLADYLGVLPELFERWPLERRYVRAHVTKQIRSNWKLVQEAFMESYHVITTHPQLLTGFGDANSQYDVFGNVARAISPRGVASPLLAWEPSEQEMLDSALDRRADDPVILEVDDGSTARRVLADSGRRGLRAVLGEAADELCDAEAADSYFLNVFPNIHPWGGYNQIFYRFRPDGDDHEACLMEVMLLGPYAGERPAPAPEVRLGAEDHWRDATEQLGSLARVFDQDEFNLEAVQKGLRSTWREHVTLSRYQELKVRHFHQLYQRWVVDPSGVESGHSVEPPPGPTRP